MIVKGIRDKDINLYKFNIELIETNVIVVEEISLLSIKSKSWHERLGHLGFLKMQFMSKWKLVVGILAFELLFKKLWAMQVWVSIQRMCTQRKHLKGT